MGIRSTWRARPASFALVVACAIAFVAVFVAALLRAESPARATLHSLYMLDDLELLESAGALSVARVWIDGQWWRTLSAALLHGSWLHLVLNAWGLWAVGSWTERVWGPWRQLGLFVWASLGGSLASLAWAEAPLVVGASGGIFGLAGALVVVRVLGQEHQQKLVEPVSAKVLSFWLIFWLVVGALLPLLGVSALAQAGHIGGLVTGCVLGLFWSLDPQRRAQRAGAMALALTTIGGLAAAANAPQWRPNYHLFLGLDHFVRAEYQRGLPELELALASNPEDAEMHNYVAYTLAEEGLELDRAEALVLTALGQDEDNADYLDTLGWIQCQRGDVEDGRETLGRAAAAATRDIPEIDEHLELCGE